MIVLYGIHSKNTVETSVVLHYANFFQTRVALVGERGKSSLKMLPLLLLSLEKSRAKAKVSCSRSVCNSVAYAFCPAIPSAAASLILRMMRLVKTEQRQLCHLS